MSKLLFRSVIVGCDHAAFDMKNKVVEYLKTMPDLKVFDNGCYDTKSVDYPDIAKTSCEKITSKEYDVGILLCGSGIGISIAANKVHGIRAALCHDYYSAQMCRKHNDANVLCFGARNTGEDIAKQMVDIFLKTEWEGLSNERHKKRVELISKMEQ
jgi:ribose 5-phosphate isomerase B